MTRKTGSGEGSKPLADVIEAYGADPARWPREYAELYEVAHRDPELSGLLGRERALDLLLDRLPATQAPSGARARLEARLDAADKGRREAAVIPFSAGRAAASSRTSGPPKGPRSFSAILHSVNV